MNGASNNVLAGKMLESLHGVPEYPWLCVEWCTPHLANVVLGQQQQQQQQLAQSKGRLIRPRAQ
jgi:hypothetical protein